MTRATSCGTALLFLLTAALPSSFAQDFSSQQQTQQKDVQTTRVTTSRAEEEAERMVSLSAENIIAILQKEPGLLLEVKKMLVRTAYEQGRILDPGDLTDEALYRVIVRDENVRVLITQEIEDREYIRVKPTKEELAREELERAQQIRKGPQTAETEDEFWRRHDWETQMSPKLGNQQQQEEQQQQPPTTPEPYDSRRAVQRAQSQYSNGDSTQYTGIDSFGAGGLGGANSSGLPLDVLGMQSMSPDQLSSLTASRMSGATGMSPAAQLNPAALA
ncbi:MAG: hypothetical protein ACRD2S_08815, partial [Terriglobales bacterium]